MNTDELKKKCAERAKIFQQAMESCHSSSPMDCIEWFADRIAELEQQVSYLEDNLRVARKDRANLQLEVGRGLKEFIKDCPYSALKLYANAELEQENAELSMKRKAERKIFQGIVEKKNDQLTNAKKLLDEFLDFESSCMERGIYISDKIRTEAKQFLSEVEK